MRRGGPLLVVALALACGGVEPLVDNEGSTGPGANTSSTGGSVATTMGADGTSSGGMTSTTSGGMVDATTDGTTTGMGTTSADTGAGTSSGSSSSSSSSSDGGFTDSSSSSSDAGTTSSSSSSSDGGFMSSSSSSSSGGFMSSSSSSSDGGMSSSSSGGGSGSTGGGAGVTWDVSIQTFAFSPPQLTIDAGDTVRWTNLDPVQHSVESSDAFNNITNNPMDSPLLNQFDTFEFTFVTPGTYLYRCEPHGFMQGSIDVQ